MFLFLLVSVPITYLLLLSVTGQTNQPAQVTLIPFVKGSLLFLPVLVAVLVLEYAVPNQFNPAPLYLRYALLRQAVPFAVAVAGALIVTRGGIRTDLGAATTAVLSFFSGFYMVFGIFDAVVNIGRTDPYVLFLMPAGRIVILLLAPYIVIAAVREVGLPKAAMILANVALPFLLGAVPLLYRVGFRQWALVAAVGLLAAAVLVYLRLVLQALPRGHAA